MTDLLLPYQNFESNHVYARKKPNETNKLMKIVTWQTPKGSRNKPYNDSSGQSLDSPPRRGFNATPFHVGFMEGKVTPRHNFTLLRFSPASIIPPELHTNSVIYHWHCIILSIKVVIKTTNTLTTLLVQKLINVVFRFVIATEWNYVVNVYRGGGL